MKKMIPVFVASLFAAAGSASAADNLYLNEDVKGDGGNWQQSYTGYKTLINVNQGSHTITGYDLIDVTHAQEDDNPVIRVNGGTLKMTAGEVKLTGGVVNNNTPIILHAIGGEIDITADRDVTLVSEKSNVIMSQADKGKNLGGKVVVTAGGSITATSEVTTVLAGLLQDQLDGLRSVLELKAAKDVNITSTGSTALQLYNNDKNGWKGDKGAISVNVAAQTGSVNISGATYGVSQKMDVPGAQPAQSTITAAQAVNVTGGTSAFFMTGQNANTTNTATVQAPVVTFTSTNEKSAEAAVNIGASSSLTVGDGKNATQVLIEAKNGKGLSTVAGSSVLFQKSTVVSSGSVDSKGELKLDGSSLELAGSSTLNAASLTGDNGRILVNEVAKNGKTVTISDNQNTGLQIGLTGAANDKYATVEEAAAALASTVEVKGDYTGFAESGAVADGWSKNADGSYKVVKNESMSAIEDFNAMTLVHWRSEGNHIVQRLGDVRDGSGKVGAWARVYGYSSSYSDGVSTDYKANSIQAGGDYRVNDTWLVGGAFSYTDGEGTFSNGSSDSDGYSLAAYLSGFFDCGAYVDLVGRVGRLSTDITAASQSSVFKSSYDNTTFGLSAEVGYHWKVNQTFYVEPQAELTYGFVKGDDFTGSNGASISQDDFQSLVGRLGARFGASFAEGAGTVYAHASVNHEFLGDADFTATSGTSRDFSVDLSGTWFSYGVGAQFNTSKNINFYGVLERSNGSEYDEDYRYSVGMRYAF